MTSILDSKPTFEARLIACGVSTVHRGLLFAKGIDTLARLAWASNSVPGVGSDTDFVAVIEAAYQVGPGGVDSGDLSSIRRLWFEAHTVGIAEMRAMVERTADSAPRKRLVL